MDLIEVMDDLKVKKIIELILIATKTTVSFVISITPDQLDRMFSIESELKEAAIVHKMKPLSYNQTKDFILVRLNEARKEKSEKLDPFNEKEVKNIWHKSKGNPRMILLLCATIYDAKINQQGR